MKIRQYLLKYGLRVAGVLLLVVVIALAATAARAGIAGPLQNSTQNMKMPLQQAATAFADWAEDMYGYLFEYNSMVEQINDLKGQVASLEADARDYDEMQAENIRLKRLLELSDQHTDYVFESAKVVSWDTSNYVSAFTISKGASSGIEIGDCVITEYNAIVGQVVALGENWATVRTIIDVNMNIGAINGGIDNYTGMIVGEYSLMRNNLTRIMYLSSNAQIFEADTLLTSGSGGSFPAGIVIGKVTHVMSEAGGQTTYGVVAPACDLDALSQVFIIKDFGLVDDAPELEGNGE